MNHTITAAFTDELMKLSATKFVKLLREGKLSTDATKKIMREYKKPRTIRAIGGKEEGGLEGVTDLVTHPSKGVAVRKTYDPDSPFVSKRDLEKKIRVMKKMKKDPDMPEYLGREKSKPVTYHEYIEGKPLHKSNPPVSTADAMEPMGYQTKERFKREMSPRPISPNPFGGKPSTRELAARKRAVSGSMERRIAENFEKGVASRAKAKTGIDISDIHAQNIIVNPAGKMKAVDMLPTRTFDAARERALDRGLVLDTWKRRPAAEVRRDVLGRGQQPS